MLRERGTKSDRLPSYNMELRSQSLGISPPRSFQCHRRNVRPSTTIVSSKVPRSTGTTLASLAGWAAVPDLEIRRANTSISAHDPPGTGQKLLDHHRALPLLCEDAQGMIEYVSKVARCHQEGCCSANAPSMDRFLRDPTTNADRVSYFDEGQKLRRSIKPKAYTRVHRARFPRCQDAIWWPPGLGSECSGADDESLGTNQVPGLALADSFDDIRI